MLISPVAEVKDLNVAIIGGGLMGHALASIFVAHGASVTICETSEAGRASLERRIALALETLGRPAAMAGSWHAVASTQEIAPACQLVIEAIPENLGLKRELFAELEQLLPSAIFATNSSVYRVGDVASRMQDRSRAIGTHWWNPPHLVPIVEVIQGEETDPDLVMWMIHILRALGKEPVHVRKDTPGFIGNRLQHALWREALALLEEGVADAATIDLVVRQTLGLKLAALGPLENADYVGLDLTLAIHQYVFPALSRAVEPSHLLVEAVRHGRLGAKSGQGLLPWPPGQVERVAERLAQQLKKATAE
jgi:3-hydroxybutyryl-CoA dehydrogenase